MKWLAMIFTLMLFSCKKEIQPEIDKKENTETVAEQKQLEIIKCFKSSYEGDFNGSTIQLSIDNIAQIDDHKYKIFGSTTHKENKVGYEGTLQIDKTSTTEAIATKKIKYDLQEKASEHGSGKFSGHITLEVPVANNNFNYDWASVKFIGDYIFPDGNSFPCTFGLEN